MSDSNKNASPDLAPDLDLGTDLDLAPPPPPDSHRWLWLGGMFGLGLLSGAIGLAGLQGAGVSLLGKQADPSPTAAAVLLETPSPSTTIAALGRLEPQEKVIHLAAPSTLATARVQALQVQVGATVAAQQIVAVLDSYPERQAQLQEARSQVNNAQAQLRQVEAGASVGTLETQRASITQLEDQYRGDLQVQAAQVARLQAELDNAAAEYERYQELFGAGAVSASTLDSKQTARQAAAERLREAKEVQERLVTTGRARIAVAEAELRRLAEVRSVDVAVAETAVATAIAAQARAEAALEQTLIRAPISGQILEIHSREGEMIGPEGVVSLGQTDRMYAIVEVDEGDIDRVKPGQAATVASVYGGFGGELEGVVDQVGLRVLDHSLYDPVPTGPSDARIVEVRVRLTEADSDRVRHLTHLQVQAKIDVSSPISLNMSHVP